MVRGNPKMADTPKPMDDAIREQAFGTPATNQKRVCWAIKQLVAEVHELFPETPVEYGDYDGRNTALTVTFDLTDMEGGDSVVLNSLMETLHTDERVAEVATADYEFASVRIKPGARTQDVRTEFGLTAAYEILTEPDGDDEGGWVTNDEVRAAFGLPADVTGLAARGLPGSPTYFGGSL